MLPGPGRLRASLCVAVALTLVSAFFVPAKSVWLPGPVTSSLPATTGQLRVHICGNKVLLAGPAKPPKGAVVVRAGNDRHAVGETWLVRPNTTYWFAPGRHTLGASQYAQVYVAEGDTFIGAPGAVIDGQGKNNAAFEGDATHVTIENLTIKDFTPPNGQSVVNHDAAALWTVKFNTIEDNSSPGTVNGPDYPGGAALGMGSGDQYEYNCLIHNGEYGLNAAGSNTLFAYNEVAWNGLADFPDESGCGCSGGIKYWATTNATVEGNYIHDNYNVGLWFDTDNQGATVVGNVISRNWAEGMVYEISYNAEIRSNSFVDNGWGVGSYQAGGFPYGDAIYINGSGGSRNIDGGYQPTVTVSGNQFVDNWDGVVVYQNPDRICGTSDNSSTGYCTLGDPARFTPSSCPAHIATSKPGEKPDYFDGCQWKTNNVRVIHNTFKFDPSHIAKGRDTLPEIINSRCDVRSNLLDTNDVPPRGNHYWCGFNAMFAAGGTMSPFEGYVVANALMGKRDPSGERPDHNVWANNAYFGPWAFQAYVQGASRATTNLYPRGVATTVNFAQWQSIWKQDLGSTYSVKQKA